MNWAKHVVHTELQCSVPYVIITLRGL